MKTPMQELIEIIKKRQEDDEAMPFMYNDKIIALAESLLEKEKEFALNLWGQYEKECIIYNDYLGDHAYSIDAIEWYDQTFKTKEK